MRSKHPNLLHLKCEWLSVTVTGSYATHQVGCRPMCCMPSSLEPAPSCCLSAVQSSSAAGTFSCSLFLVILFVNCPGSADSPSTAWRGEYLTSSCHLTRSTASSSHLNGSSASKYADGLSLWCDILVFLGLSKRLRQCPLEGAVLCLCPTTGKVFSRLLPFFVIRFRLPGISWETKH